jgi:hypothetical protein
MTARGRRPAGATLLLLAALAAQAAAAQPAAVPEGFRATPSLGFREGDHRLDLSLSHVSRSESWDARAPSSDTFYGERTRLGIRYGWREVVALFGELQNTYVGGLAPDTSGAGASYRTAMDGASSGHSNRVRQLFLELQPRSGLALRAGRFDIRGGLEVTYPEPDWAYLKSQRLSQRLVGTVGWSIVERSNDGAQFVLDLGPHQLAAFAARPTTGVFDVEGAYERQYDILYGGATWTVKRGTWLPGSELRLFGLGYKDDRPVDDGGLPDPIEVFTGGASLLAVHPLGPGSLDLLLWVAGQGGRYDGLDHAAFAGIAELGYRLAEVPCQPWLRVGLNAASGDDDPGDGDHRTFFNVLPTNHLYYGFADQLAFQNLIDWFLQLKLTPLPRVDLNVFLHQLSLAEEEDARYSGTGAFDKSSFGFAAQPSGGHRSVGTELDAVVSFAATRWLTLEAGYSYLFGHSVFDAFSDEDTRFGYVMATLRY